MSKPRIFTYFTIAAWTLVIALISFTAGRMAAPMEEDTAVPALSVTLTNNSAGQTHPAQTGVAAAVPDQVKSSQQRSTTHIGGGSYAADYQSLQALVALAATNPQLAMEQAQRFKGAIKARAETAILEVWGGVDPYGAWNWVTSFQPENGSQFIKLLEVIGRSQPQTAVSYAEKYVAAHRELRKDIYVATLTGITQAGDYRLATQLLGSLQLEPEVKAELTSMVVTNWAAYEPQAAMKWVASQPEDTKAATLEQLGSSWADADPEGAVNFAASLRDQSRDNLLLPSFKKWLEADSAAATSWLSAQHDKAFDPLLSEVATMPELMNDHVKNALAWAGQIHEPELRINTLTSILSAFKQKDPSSAAAYLQEISYLTDAERSRLHQDLAF